MKIEIDDEIAKKAETRAKEEGISLSEYVEKLLEEPEISAEDEEKVKERLRGLGYLD